MINYKFHDTIEEYRFADGNRFIRNFKEGESQTGYAKIYYKNSIIYEGETKEMKPHGKGILTYKDGDRFEGSFVNGVRNGYSKMYYKDGTERSIYWNYGKAVDNSNVKFGESYNDDYEDYEE